ncbi:MAG TPA: efflux RND transporter periplasmic adaptor subunit [Fimbriimonas sp.]|nr:efflux RND transporter periplasmic adaptor subunit [Fimbriimonas sp.]
MLYWGVPAVALLALIGWRFSSLNTEKKQESAQSSGPKAASVRVASATSRVLVQSVQAVGSVESPYKVEISPKTAGRIEYLQVREGDSVKAGEVLLKIDPSDLQGAVIQQQANVAEAKARFAQAKISESSTNVGVASQVAQQKANLGSAEANMAQLQQNYRAQIATAEAQVSAAKSALANANASLNKENATLGNLQIKYDRTLYLYKQNFIASQDVDDARTAIEVQKQAKAVAEGQVASAQSQVKVQEQNLLIVKRKGLADIAAGKAGVDVGKETLRVARANRSQSPAYQQNLDALQSQVTAAVAQLNQAQARLADTVIRATIDGTVTARKADPGALASSGTPVLEIQTLDWMYVTATIPIDFSAQIHEGQTAEIQFDELPGKVFSGPITNINPAADPQSRNFGIKVRLDNPRHAIRPGMYGHVKIVTGQVDASVVVPREAIQTDSDGHTTVTVIDKDSVAHVRPVKVGASDEKGVQVISGVQTGDKVVVLTFTLLKEGKKVSISTAGEAPSQTNSAK